MEPGSMAQATVVSLASSEVTVSAAGGVAAGLSPVG